MGLRVLRNVIRNGTALLGHQASKFARDTTGGVAAIVAITAPIIIGSMGLGAETSYWMITDQKVQSAADVTAHAVGSQQASGAPPRAMQNIAEFVIGASDIDLTATTIALNSPPTSGQYAGDPSAVEVVITSTLPRYFSRMYAKEEVRVTARAVAAGVPAGKGCILGLNTTAPSTVSIQGSVAASLSGCEIASNSNDAAEGLVISGDRLQVTADCIRVVGRAQVNGPATLDCGSVVTGAGPAADPFADIAEPSSVGACNTGSVQNLSVMPAENHPSGMRSIRFCNGLTLSGSVVLHPGLYIVEGGDLTINANTTVIGSGILIFVRDGAVRVNGSATLNLTAPSDGPFEGLVVFAGRSNTNDVTLNGNALTIMNGAIYAPASLLRVLGNNSTSSSSCTQYIGDRVWLSGNGSLNLGCDMPFSREIELPSQISVVE